MTTPRMGQRIQRRNPYGESPLVVIALGQSATRSSEPITGAIMKRVEPRIRHLIRLSDPNLSAPDYVCEWAHGEVAVAAAIRRCHRAVVLAELRGAGLQGTVTAWHHRMLDGSGENRLSALHLSPFSNAQVFHHLPLWLEDDLPAGGLDFIGIHTYTIRSAADRNRMIPLAISAVTSVLWRIVRESGADDELRQVA